MKCWTRVFSVAFLCLGLLPVSALGQGDVGITIEDRLDQRADPSGWTKRVNAGYQRYLWNSKGAQDETRDFLDAQRGRIAKLDPLVITEGDCKKGQAELCKTIWDLTAYEFLNPHIADTEIPEVPYGPHDFSEVPDSANPSLWRNAVLNTIHGVFEVVEGEIYQVRGYDLSNMSAIKGDHGWIIIDPLTTEETAKAALDNLNAAYAADTELEPLPVSAVIFTHSHVDHFGGVGGLAKSQAGVLEGARIYAPVGFVEESVSENVIVGNAMGRRATYMYGPLLRRGPKGQIDGGLGKSTPAGTTGLAAPDCLIGTGTFSGDCGDSADWHTGEAGWDPTAGWGPNEAFQKVLNGLIDGVEIQFQNVPGSEAPAEMLFYFPELQALCASEDVTHTFHNVLTLRGANVRDSLMWAKYLHETLKYFADAEVIFASHHWPTWNKKPNSTEPVDPEVPNRVAEIIEQQRDLYRYIHDQSVRLTNKGYTIQEVGEMVKLPPELGKQWFNRSYYGTVNHNAKAVYQRYIGWFDGNPASLHQLPPVLAAQEYVRYMGGVGAILDLAKDDYDNGKYRWVAMVLNHVVFSAPRDLASIGDSPGPIEQARLLLADTYDQLAYQAESGPWRNFYLTGAMELRNGVLPLPAVKTFTRETVEAMNLEMVFDFMAVHINGLDAGSMDHLLGIEFWQSGTADAQGIGADPMTAPSTLHLKNGVLNYDIGKVESGVAATMKMTRSFLNNLVMGEDADGNPLDPSTLFCAGGVQTGSPEAENCIVVEGSQSAVDDLFSVLDSFDFWFEIVGPGTPIQTVPLH